MRRLRTPDELERSHVVANCAMNRERRLTGANSYAKDLGVDVLGLLEATLARRGEVAWLDLCCGAALALAEAAERLRSRGRVEIVGVDLVASLDAARPTVPGLTIVEANLERWAPSRATRTFDLVTCVHGLHYVGDKLDLLRRALTWLRPDGVLLANLDLANLRLDDGRPAGRRVASALRAAGLSWHARRRVLRSDGPRRLELGLTYVGADDAAGPNDTGQPAVDSYYRVLQA